MARKLAVRERSAVLVIDAPAGLTLGPLPPGVRLVRSARGAGLVDNKSASIDATFQGLQFVYRLADR
ncbi:MAG: hypothetical protein KatS3mg014_1932 [Actinomycetota bacterium]|nr:MAG: hypothetical protein KatS3mg014_1932 [Actinomycetota bacterium]